jgi:hypothetical protein
MSGRPETAMTRPQATIAWELRGHWAAHRRVALTLSDRCIQKRIEGHVDRIATTDAFVVVDGWHVPLQDVLAVYKTAKATRVPQDAGHKLSRPQPGRLPAPVPAGKPTPTGVAAEAHTGPQDQG